MALTTVLPVAAAEYPGEPLRLGSRGEAVRVWQEALGIRADGDFGEQTRQTTIRWQIENGLVGDGVVGPASWRVMFPDATVDLSAVQVTIEGAGNGHGVGLTQFGAKGMATAGYTHVQILEHFYQGSSIKNLADAIPGSWVLTEPQPIWVGIRQNRSELTFEVTAGRVKVCFDGDYNSYPVLAEGNAPARDNTFTDLALTRLAELGYLQAIPSGFNQTVAEAVISLQKAKGLQADGSVGGRTWEALLEGSGLPDCAGSYWLESGERLVVTPAGDGSCSTNLVGEATRCHLSIGGLTPDNRVGLVGLNYGGNTTEFAHGVARVRPGGARVHFSMQMDIEDYVAGIAEVPTGWPAAALRAQAVAARSYAIYGMLRRGSESSLSSSRRSSCWCHVVSDTRDQVYAGWNRQIQGDGRWESEGARATAGMVLTHPEEPVTIVQAFYSSSSGGATEDSSALWGTSGRPYLVSVKDPWSIDPAVNPGAFWTKTLSLTALLEIFNLEDRFSDVISVNTVPYPWGSAEHIKILGIRGGNRVTERVPATNLKSALRLRSRYFEIDYTSDWWAPPPAPTGVHVAGGNHATVTWDPAPSRFDPQSYTVTVAPAHVNPVVVNAPATQAVISGLRAGVEYSFTVTATNQVGTGPPSAATAAQVVIAERPYPGTVIRAGSTGETVRVWQEALGIAADGEFGPATAEATRRWQQDNGLTPDGIVGEQSWNKMFAATPASEPEPAPAPQPEPEPKPEPESKDPPAASDVPSYPGFLLRVGSQGKWVRTWQTALGTPADGHFGTDTALATQRWQEANGLTADGVVGLQSWRTMFPGAGVETSAPPPPITDTSDSTGGGSGSDGSVPSYPGSPLGVGSQGRDVIIWQQALGIGSDGYFGSATLVATKAWQYQQGLTADGTVDQNSWQTMFQGASVRQPGPTEVSNRGGTVTPQAPAYPGRPLSRGSRGAAVVTWQKALGVQADGVFGPQTERATRTWQGAQGLTASGIVDADSWKEMFSPGSSVSTGGGRSGSLLFERGESSPLVTRWQEALKRELPGETVEITGVYDQATVSLTRFWQRIVRVGADGDVTQSLWARMFPGGAGGSPQELSAGDCPDFQPSSVLLGEGCEGALVTRWQEGLKEALSGENVEVTGVFDRTTAVLTRFWQRIVGVGANGKVSETDWYRMFPDEG